MVKNVYFKTIYEQKKKHWDDFLEDKENIWQASKYLSNNTDIFSFTIISGLIIPKDYLVISSLKIVTTLMAKFFSLLPFYLTPQNNMGYKQFTALAITKAKIENAIFKTSPSKSPGYDRVPVLVWQKTWPVLKKFLISLFQNLL